MRALSPRRALVALLALGAAAAIATGDDDARASSEVGRAIDAFHARRRALEATNDPGALAAALALLERLDGSAPLEKTAPLDDRIKVDRELVRARLLTAIERHLDVVAGRASKLRTGAPPERGTESEEKLAKRVALLARHVADLVPDEIAVARSDLRAERSLFTEGPVAQALSSLEQALDGTAPVASTSVRDYLRVLRTQANWRGSVEELVALAESESRTAGERLEVLATECGAASASALIERLKEEGLREDPIVVAREEAMRSARFAAAHFSVPDEVVASLRVEEGDPRSRTPFGHYLPVNWRGPQGHYVVTAMTGSDAGAVSRRRESFRLMIRGVAAHEGVPGHHLHFATAARTARPVRTLPFEGATTEGWGLFIEGVLSRAGYFDEPREARSTPLRMRRWRADRVILDAGLQTGTLSREQAIARLSRDVGFDRATATDEVDRYRERAGYYAGYLLGARAFEEAERRALERRGPAGARAVRDRVLTLGPAAPLRAVVKILREDEGVSPVR